MNHFKLVKKGVNVAKAWSDNPLLTAFRVNSLAGLLNHEPRTVKYHVRSTCEISCAECETIDNNGGVHSGKTDAAGRKGGKTVSFCGSCEVFLGMERMISLGNRTPFGVWHTERVLPSHPFVVAEDEADAGAFSGPSTATVSARKRRKSMAKEAQISTMRELNFSRDDEDEGE